MITNGLARALMGRQILLIRCYNLLFVVKLHDQNPNSSILVIYLLLSSKPRFRLVCRRTLENLV